jgi:thiol:disulfide interchange protein
MTDRSTHFRGISMASSLASAAFSITISIVISVGVAPTASIAQANAIASQPAGKSAASMSAAPYDPKSDPELDLKAAIAHAQRDGKNILLKVGGEWCVWCHIMDKFFDDNAALEQARVANFVTLKVNYSPANKNEKFLSKFPKVKGYPHLFILDKNGKLLHSQDTETLESGKSYSLAAMTEFITRWSPKKT